MEYPTYFSFFKQISLLFFFINLKNQIQWKSNEKQMKNKCSNSIKNENDNSISISSNRFWLGPLAYILKGHKPRGKSKTFELYSVYISSQYGNIDLKLL